MRDGELPFCCVGCRAVYQILKENQLDQYYKIGEQRGPSLRRRPADERFDYLDDEVVRRRLLDFADGETARVTLHVPQMYCSACVWLLENLARLQAGIISAQVNFPRRQLAVVFREDEISLRQLVELLATLGYTPKITLGSADRRSFLRDNRPLVLRTGVAGFAFANIMLFSFPDYLATITDVPREFAMYFGYLSLLLALPVFLYSSSDFFRTAWIGLRQRRINLDLPISIGIIALFTRSAYEILTGIGTGYLDSFSGLVFFLLVGRIVQAKTYQALTFDRDYKHYFPLFVTRIESDGERQVGLERLTVGDRLRVRNGELIVADAVLTGARASIDYSFVTGESAPVFREIGETVFAGGRVVGGAAVIETIKPVSQSYLVSLWNSETFGKREPGTTSQLAQAIAGHFTWIVGLIAVSTFLYWLRVDVGAAVTNATAVLIVACPCALALAIPFGFGTAMQILGRHGLFFREPVVIESMATADTIVFDKTGTLTQSESGATFVGEALSEEEAATVLALAGQSTHPLSRSIATPGSRSVNVALEDVVEIEGRGIAARLRGREYRLGSADWVTDAEATLAKSIDSRVHLSIAGENRGYFGIVGKLRDSVDAVIPQLQKRYHLWLVSGDNDAQAGTLTPLFGSRERLKFSMSPHDKLSFVEDLKRSGNKVIMVGDGLNDSGALAAATVGIAVADDVAQFSPACDAILHSSELRKLPQFLDAGRITLRIVIVSLILSLIYNLIGLYFAVSGQLSPIIAAILMPVSSLSVVGFAVFGTRLALRGLA